MIETKVIPGYQNYECDIEGNVYSLNYNRTGKRKKMKKIKTRGGYLRVDLCKNGKTKTKKIHRLVMLTFYGESDLQVNHIDGNKTNNNLFNLEYCSAFQNMQHAYRLGLVNNTGEKHGKAKLTKKQVIEIKKTLLNPYIGISRDLATEYEVTPNVIGKIKRGETWKHVTID